MAYKVKYEVDGFAALSTNEVKDLVKDAYGFVGLWWHKNLKANKFTNEGARKYKFAPRSGNPGSGRKFKGSYVQNKILKRKNGQNSRSIGENKPNVWSGVSRQMALANRKVKTSARKSGIGSVTVIINAPALNFPKPGSRTNPNREVTTVIPAEEKTMSSVGSNRLRSSIRKIKKRKVVKPK